MEDDPTAIEGEVHVLIARNRIKDDSGSSLQLHKYYCMLTEKMEINLVTFLEFPLPAEKHN